tara:strand:+ start:169 stop:405 length:237 start_codon:yes stop_codon:yes gene_type:complete
MVGRPSKKIQCEARRKYDGQQCQAKGLLTKKGSYICRLHGGLSRGQTTIEGRIRALKNLKPFRNKSDKEIRELAERYR